MEHDLSKTMAELPSAGKKQNAAARLKSVIPAAAVPAALAVLLWFVFRDQLVRAVPVETARVILLEQENNDAVPAGGTPALLFQASGWIEPDPWHVSIAVKTDGYIESVFVREGDAVTNGQVVAVLDPADHKLVLAAAEADVRKHKAALQAQRNRADAEAKQVEAARFRVEAAAARLNRERDTSVRFANSKPGVISHADRVEAEQAVIEFEAEEKAACAALTALEAKAVSAEAETEAAEAALASAVEERAAAQLALDRTVVRANMDGIILRRFVKPGDKRMVMADDPHSAQIAEIYDPEKLQVRVDVPLAEAGKMEVGQTARITTAMLSGRTFDGRVTSIAGRADLQRNTLQAKVEIRNPDPRMRPEVLCRVEFLGAADPVEGGGHSLWIPEAALDSDSDEQSVWIVDPLHKTVGARSVKLTGSSRDGFRGAAEGVRANETVVVKAAGELKEGLRVKEVGK